MADMEFTMNGASWTNPSIPVLVQLMAGVPPADVIPEDAIQVLESNRVVEISIPGYSFAGPVSELSSIKL